MNWNISAWAIRHPIPVIVIFMIFGIMGWFAFAHLGIDENPNIDVPMVSVSVSMAGAAPSEMETQITRKVEDAVAGIGNIKHINSSVGEGSSNTNIEFELGTSTDRAVNDVRDAVTRIRQQLPQAVMDPVVQRVDFVGYPFATYTVASPNRSIAELSWLVDNQISRALLSVRGVGQVNRSGGVDREIHLDLDPVRLEALGITADYVSQQILGSNINLPGGRENVGQGEQSIRTLGSAETVTQLQGSRIKLPNGGWVGLETLGAVRDTSGEPRHRAMLDGQPVVSFSLMRSSGSNLVEVAAGADAALALLKERLPPDVAVTKVRTSARYVMESYHASLDALIIGASLAVLVIWLFLRDWRAALISGLAMPMSVIPTFFIMKWAGFTLNNMSLLGLSLVIGILVDDAIVEIENIVRHIYAGKRPYDAAMEAADEIGLAVVATTLTIIVVFVPVAFMGGIPGQFFKQFGLTVAVAVFFSLAVARLMTPLMAAYWLKEPRRSGRPSVFVLLYDRLLGWAMQHRLLTVAVAVVFFAFGMVLFKVIPTNLISSSDRGETFLSVDMPPGTRLDDTTQACQQLTSIFRAHPEVRSVYASVGGSSSINTATLYVTLTPREARHKTQQELEDEIRPQLKNVPGVRTTFMSGGLSGSITVLLASDNPAVLQRTADDLIQQMRQVPGLQDVQSDASLQRPEILVEPDTALAAEQGVSVQAIARTALIATLGDVDQNLAKFDLPDRQINIRVQLDPRYRNDLETIRHLRVMGNNGRLVPLDAVARVRVGSGPSQINRYNRERQISIDATLTSGMTLGDAIKAVHGLPAYVHMPPEVRDRPAGNAEIQADVFNGFGAAIGAAILFIYGVLVLLFGGFLQPLTIMVSLPLSIGGALLGLLLSHQSLGLYSLIGIVMLMGLATKNAILLVEYCLMAMHRGVPQREAIMQAGEARMRPILMTTVAMIVGMVPIAMGLGAGSEVRAPMALAVIGGLVTSTFLTLIVVPVVFSLVEDLKNAFLRRFRLGNAVNVPATR